MTRIMVRTVFAALVSSAPMLLAAEQAHGQSTDEDLPLRLVDFSFPGGTIAEYLDALRQKVGKEISIVVTDPRAGEPRLPAVELHGVTVDAAINLIAANYRLENGRKVRVIVEGVGGFGGEHGAPLYRVSSVGIGPPAPPDVRVWTLSSLIDDQMKAEDALTAVELAVSLAGSASTAAEVRFHEATSLLVAKGTPDQIHAIDSVIEQLIESQQRRRTADTAERGVEDFVAWIDEMRKFDESQQAQAQQVSLGEAGLLHELKRLTHLVDEQAKKIQALEQRLNAAPHP